MAQAVRVGLVGCGLIGAKRVAALRPNDALVAVADLDPARAEAVAAPAGAAAATDWAAVVTRSDVDAVVVAPTHDSLAAVTLAAIDAGKHVLVEKPAARRPEELEPILHHPDLRSVCVHVGFNHRCHPALMKAKELVDAGAVGPLLFIRARYGHGGRVGYEREWRADPDIAGGGELIDQGIHLIDLSRWFLGEFSSVVGFTPTYFWDMPVEDNAFLLLRTPRDQVAWLHASWTEWKNTFCFEIAGRDGKLQVDGLGGSYGTERLTYYRMLPEMGPPDVEEWSWPGADGSWRTEWDQFAAAVEAGAPVRSTIEGARAALTIVSQAYQNREVVA